MPDFYLVDSNVLISAHRVHYPFSTRIFHPFWQALEQASSNGVLLMLDVVYDELVPKHTPINERDLLAQWTESVFKDKVSAVKQMKSWPHTLRFRIISFHAAAIHNMPWICGAKNPKPILGSLLQPNCTEP